MKTRYVYAIESLPRLTNAMDAARACGITDDDLAVVAHMCERLLVMQHGTDVEELTLDALRNRAAKEPYTKDLLVPGEQYGLGGPDTVRGYLLREVANDRGYSGQAELYTPDIARHLEAPDELRVRFLAFYDYGSLKRNDPLPGEIDHSVLASTGVGLRLSYAKSVSLRFDVANILKPTLNRDDGSWRVSAALAIIY